MATKCDLCQGECKAMALVIEEKEKFKVANPGANGGLLAHLLSYFGVDRDIPQEDTITPTKPRRARCPLAIRF